MKGIIPFFAILLLASCAKKEPEGNLHITGNIDGLKKGLIAICKMEDTALVVIDSIRINGDSYFESHSTLDSPQMLYMFLDRGVSRNIDNSLEFFAEPGNINIATTLERFYANAKISGSKNHDLYLEFRKTNSRFTDQQLDLTAKRLEAFKDKTPFDEQAYIDQSNAIESRRNLFAINFAINHKNKEVAPFIAVSETRRANLKLLQQVLDTLTPEVANSKYGTMLKDLILERRKVEIAPPVQ